MFEKLNADEKAALDELQKGSDANAENVSKIATLEAQVEALEKGEPGDDEQHELLKGLSDEQRTLVGPVVDFFEKKIEAQTDEAKVDREKFEKRESAARTEKIAIFVKSLDSIGTPDEELIEALEKAHDAGSGEILEKTLAAANEAASDGGLEPIGSEAGTTVITKGGKGSPAAAYAVVEKRAHELRKGREGEITFEGAYLEAEIELPDEAAIAAEVATLQ
jgi:hypothetical protein